MYMHILVAIGGSPWSDAALTYAIDLATRMKAKVHLLTVLTLPDAGGGAYQEVPFDQARADVEKAAQELLEEGGDLAQQAGVAYTTQSRWGAIPDTILDTATESGCDLIVLGTRQEAGSPRQTLGRIAHRVAANAPQPVLVVKGPLDLEASLGRRVLVATGGSPWSKYAVEHAIGLAQVLGLEVCVVHVASGPLPSRKPPVESAQLFEQAQSWATSAGIVYQGVLASGSVPEAILEAAIAKQCSAIIMGTRLVAGSTRLTLGTIIDMVAARADLPVLIVKPYGMM